MSTKDKIKEIVQNVRVSDPTNKYKTDLVKTKRRIESLCGCQISVRDMSINIDFDDISESEIFRFSGKSGEVKRDGDKEFSIILNTYDSELRKRFTESHEFGHIVLEHLDLGEEISDLTVFDRSKDWNSDSAKEEKEANAFAAELLMPENLVNDFFKTKEVEMSEIKEAAGYFGVSESAMMTRLNFLNYRF